MENRKEKLALYNRAKEAYYNGQEIMTDYEFDTLEKELGLENKSEVGSKHNPSYTIKHPFVMGSLSKVQIHKDKENKIDWEKYFGEAKRYFGNNRVICTPKYDGCSFEIYVKNGNYTISSRGDGSYGKDLKQHLKDFIPYKLLQLADEFVLRGEVLVKKSIFENKYAEQFTNPRSFVSGVLNSDYSFDSAFKQKLNDLSIVIYDYRIKHEDTWEDYDWTEIEARIKSDSFFDSSTRASITSLLPSKMWEMEILSSSDLEWVYNDFAQYRESCEFALDGIVIKPIQGLRELNIVDHRPKDCVAIKFIPMLEETEVLDITWQLGKTGEYTPIIWVKPVEMDGRMVQKCSGHNIGYLKEKGVTIGAKVVMSLAGDIIPFLYKVTQPNENGEIPMPTDHEYYEDDIHLMAVLTEEDHNKMKFINSAKTLNIPTLGDSTIKQIYEYIYNNANDSMTLDFFNESVKNVPLNILLVSSEDIYFGAGAGKIGQNAKKAFEGIIQNISLADIIKSCNFKLCGEKASEQIAQYLIFGEADWSHIPNEAYSWVYDSDSNNMHELKQILNHLGKDFKDFEEQIIEKKNTVKSQIPVILTGEPNNYSSKGDFLRAHPEYRMTGSWKEVQIVFTNSLESTTGKMKKAKEKGIRIELY